jgi:hypothetical protein
MDALENYRFLDRPCVHVGNYRARARIDSRLCSAYIYFYYLRSIITPITMSRSTPFHRNSPIMYHQLSFFINRPTLEGDLQSRTYRRIQVLKTQRASESSSSAS